jgi:Domain of unknown function (DUF4157)
MSFRSAARIASPEPTIASPGRGLLQRHSNGREAPGHVPPVLHDVVRSPGHALDRSTRTFMEARFGRDFSGVRVHTDESAGASAQALDAQAYTVGRDIVFGPGRYRPGTSDGRRLIAHELTHVIQQGESGPALQAYRIGAADTAAEREAANVATLVDAGGTAPAVEVGEELGTVQRATGGLVGGGLVGAGVGAGLGAAAGGGIGALIGGVVGGAIGALVGDVLTAGARTLTSPEQTEAKLVFGTSLNFSSAKVAESSMMTLGDYARTPFDTVYLPPGTLSKPLADYMPWLIHELTHAWQSQHGVSVIRKLATAIRGASAYAYGGEAGLRAAQAAGKKFTDFNTEQQADICHDYYVALKAGADVSAYTPFIDQVKRGGAP